MTSWYGIAREKGIDHGGSTRIDVESAAENLSRRASRSRGIARKETISNGQIRCICTFIDPPPE